MGRPTWNPLRGRLCPTLVIIGFVFLLVLILLNDRKYEKGGRSNYYESIQSLNPLQFFKQSLDVDYIQNHLEQFDQMDPRLIEYTRIRYLSPPSKLPYSLQDEAITDYRDAFSDWVARFFSGQVTKDNER